MRGEQHIPLPLSIHSSFLSDLCPITVRGLTLKNKVASVVVLIRPVPFPKYNSTLTTARRSVCSQVSCCHNIGMNVMPVEAILCSLNLFHVLGSGPTHLWRGSDIRMWGSVSLRKLFLQNVIKQHGSCSKNLFCFPRPSWWVVGVRNMKLYVVMDY